LLPAPLPASVTSIACRSAKRFALVADGGGGQGFASVRRVGNGLYATISDISKSLQTVCNGGFLAGEDSALLSEGFVSPA
jgi:hypothetical protein